MRSLIIRQMQWLLLAIHGLCGSATALSQEGPFLEDLSTIVTSSGKTYNNCQIQRIDSDGLYIKHSKGIGKIKFQDLSLHIQQQFGYDLEEAARFAETDARTKANLQRAADLRTEIGKSSMYVELSRATSVNKICAEVGNLLKADSFITCDATQTSVEDEVTMRRTTTALGGEGLPVKEVKRRSVVTHLGALFIIGRHQDLIRCVSAEPFSRKLFRVADNSKVMKTGELWALDLETAVRTSLALFDVAALRAKPFSEKVYLGRRIEELRNEMDPLVTREKEILVDAGQPVKRIMVTLETRPFPAVVAILFSDGVSCTVQYQVDESAHGFDDELLKNISSSNHILDLANADATSQDYKESTDDVENVSNKQTKGFSWLALAKVSQLYLSRSGTLILAARKRDVQEKWSEIWLTNLFEKDLAVMRAVNDPKVYRKEILAALEGKVTESHTYGPSRPDTIEELLRGSE